MSEEIRNEDSSPVFDKERFVNNVQKLAKDKGLKIGDIEKTLSLSQGYLSRINKSSSRVMPNIDMIARIAQMLGTTIDALLFVDLTAASPSDEYMVSFLRQLVVDSEAFDLVWNVDTEEAIANIISMDPENVPHPLFRSLFDADKYAVAYDSRFHPYESDSRIKAMPPFYHVKINDGECELYLSRIYYTATEEVGGYEYELYMVDSVDHRINRRDAYGEVHPVCHAIFNEKNEIHNQLKYLYSIAGETLKHVKLEKPVRNAIEQFMATKNN